ncbi:MAG: dockerin type I domain-containing protein [Phycisphaerae bacterium]|nr:dockerin type I domain-containing protein [Phycisphaerae bacterium]
MRLAVVGTIVLLLSGVAMAQTDFTVDYTIQIGGDNHETQYKNDENVAFTEGSTTPPVQEGIVTWDVIAEASGSDIDGYSVQGIANLVFNIELQTEAGAAVAPKKFFSTINDGNDDSPRAVNNGVAEPFERAAFCLGWDVAMDYRWIDDGDGIVETGEYLDGLGPPAGPGRLYDPTTVGGPYMDRVQFPSTSYHGGGRMKGGVYFPDCNGNLTNDNTEENTTTDTDGNGILDVCEAMSQTVGGGLATEVLSAAKLSGMGAGYSQFTEAANNAGVGLAVASVIPNWGDFGDEWVGLGIKPVAEGQIDMTGLLEGTYKLVLTAPANSNNVIPPSFIVQSTPAMLGGFAAKAVVVNGAEVAFYWKPSVVQPIPVQPTLWQSWKTHTAVGPLAITLDATKTGTTRTTEPRNGGIEKIKITFDGSLAGAQYAGGVTITPAVSVTESTEGDNTIVLAITGDVDKTCYKIDVSTAFPVGGLKGTADPVCYVGNLIGDSNNSGTMTATDVSQVKSKVLPPWTNDNVRMDVNLSGTMTATDVSLAKSKVITGGVGACPP